MGANTALSDRERDSGFNILDIGQGRYEPTARVWHNREYVSEYSGENSKQAIGILEGAS